jgi:DNA-binding GntR family transcriptional regulator
MDIRIMFETYCVPRLIKAFKANPQINEAFLKNLADHQKTITNGDSVDSHFQNYSRDHEFHELILNCAEDVVHV